MPDNETVITKGDSVLHLWQARTGLPLRDLRFDGFYLDRWHALSPDGKWLALPGYVGGKVPRETRIVALATGEVLRTVKRDREQGHESVVFTPNSERLVSIGFDGKLRVEEVSTGKEVFAHAFPPNDDYAVSISPDGKLLGIMASRKRQYLLWDWQGGGEPRPLTVIGQLNSPDGMTFSPNGKLVAAVAGDRLVHVWDTTSGALLRRLGLPRGFGFEPLHFSPDGKFLLTVMVRDRKNQIHFWSTATWEVARTLDVEGLGFSTSADGRLLICGKQVFDLERNKDLRIENAHRGQICGLAALDQNKIITASDDGTLRLWDAATGRQLLKVNHGRENAGFAVSPDGKQLVTSSLDNTLRLWDLPEGKEVYRLPGHGGTGLIFRAVAFTKDGERFCSFGPDFYLRVYDVKRGKALQEFLLKPAGVTFPDDDAEPEEWFMFAAAPTFSPDGKTLAVDFFSSKKIYLYDSFTGKEKLVLDHAGGNLASLSFSPDGQWLLASAWGKSGGDENHRVTLWNLQTGKIEKTITPLEQGTGPACFSPDSQKFAVGSFDKAGQAKVTIYRLDGTVEAVLPGVPSRIWQLAFTHDGRGLLTAHEDHTILVWNSAALVKPQP